MILAPSVKNHSPLALKRIVNLNTSPLKSFVWLMVLCLAGWSFVAESVYCSETSPDEKLEPNLTKKMTREKIIEYITNPINDLEYHTDSFNKEIFKNKLTELITFISGEEQEIILNDITGIVLENLFKFSEEAVKSLNKIPKKEKFSQSVMEFMEAMIKEDKIIDIYYLNRLFENGCNALRFFNGVWIESFNFENNKI